jgi:hypothetical protein
MFTWASLSRHQNSGHNFDKKVAHRSFQNPTESIYFCMSVIDQNLIQEDINTRVKSDCDCYHAAQNFRWEVTAFKTYAYITFTYYFLYG